MSTVKTAKKAIKKSSKTAFKPAAKKPAKSIKSVKVSSAAKAAKAPRTSTPKAPTPQVTDTRKPLADIIRERQLAQGLENTTAFEIKLEGGENFIVASHLSPRMNDLFDPAVVTVTPKATARAGVA